MAAMLDPLRPRRPGGMGRGALIALGVHVVLLIAIALGVSWRSTEPQGVSAELWAAVPETAAPAAVAPPAPPQPPPPVLEKAESPKPAPPLPQADREADIALEKEKEKEKLRQQKEAEAQEEKKKKEQQLKAQKEEAARQEAQRDANLKRLAGLAGATGAPAATGTGLRDASPKGPSAGYGDRVRGRVKPNIFMTDTVEGSPRAEVEVRAAPDGTILSRRLTQPSGNTAWDDAVLRAIDRTRVLPRDDNGSVPSPITIVFTPQ